MAGIKLRITADLILDFEWESTLADPESREWFWQYVLGAPLVVHSNEIGDTIGELVAVENASVETEHSGEHHHEN